MQKKIYVAGMFDSDSASKVDQAVKGVQGVTNVVANPDKSQVLVDFDEGTAGIEDAINAAISSAGVDVLGQSMKLTILDGHAVNPGDLNWDMFKKYADVTVYEHTPQESVISRIGNSDAILLNKINITSNVLESCKNL